MKKVFAIIGVIVAILVIIVAVVTGVLILKFNKEKVSMNSSEFIRFMEQKGYTVQDAKSQFQEYDYIEKVYIALTNDYSYQIEFYEFIDESYATQFYNYNQSRIEAAKGNASAETNIGGKNSNKYTLSSNGKYSVVSRINNTVIFVNVEDEYRDTIKKVLKETEY